MEQANPATALRQAIKKQWWLGAALIAVCFVGFGLWASLTELSSAAIASGQVSPDGSQRTIQHLEGGIVRALNVREGDVVRKGDVLMVLDKELARANYLATFRKLQRFNVTRERLMAQERGAQNLNLDLSAAMQDDPDFRQFVANEMVKFRLKKRLLDEQTAIFQVQRQQVQSEIESLQAQMGGMRDQLALIDKELEAKRILVKKGLARKPEVFALERKRAELNSEGNSLLSTISRARQKIEEIKIAELSMNSEEMEKVAQDLSELNSEMAQAQEALNATDDILSRTDINSPIDGKVLKIHVKTVGGVVRPGEPIIKIVPIQEELILDTRLAPSDIDNVELGMKAKVQLTSFMARHMVPLDGEIFHVGADAELDEQSGEKFYNVRVRVDPVALAGLGSHIELIPGMPAEVFIQTGTHTPLRYLFDPVLKSFNRAFREEAM